MLKPEKLTVLFWLCLFTCFWSWRGKSSEADFPLGAFSIAALFKLCRKTLGLFFSSHKLLQTIQFFTGLINLYQKFIFTEFELLARCDIVGFRVHFCPEKVTKHNKSVLQ